MSGHHPFSVLTKECTPERRQRIEAKKAELRAAMPLHELRQAQVMTQKALSEILAVNQPAIWNGGRICTSRLCALTSKL